MSRIASLAQPPPPAERPDPADFTWLPAFLDLPGAIREGRGEIHPRRHVPRGVVSEMKAARIFRSATPSKFGGDFAAPHHFLRVVEAIGEVDGSAVRAAAFGSRAAAFGSANAFIAALPDGAQARICAQGPDQLYAGGLHPLHPAERLEAVGRSRAGGNSFRAAWARTGSVSGSSARTRRRGPPKGRPRPC